VTTGALVGVLLDPQPASATPAMAASTVGTSSAEALPCLGDERRLPLCFTQHPFPPSTVRVPIGNHRRISSAGSAGARLQWLVEAAP
jgi:hypothetical protein